MHQRKYVCLYIHIGIYDPFVDREVVGRLLFFQPLQQNEKT